MNDAEQPQGGRGFLRGMVMAVGFLIMLGSGLCSAGFLVSMVGELFTESSKNVLGDLGMILGMVAVWGGVPFLLGWLIWRASRKKA